MISTIFSNIPGVASLAIILLAVTGTTIAFIASAFYGRTLDAQTWNLLLLIDGTAIGLVTGQGIGSSRALRTMEMQAAAQSEGAKAAQLQATAEIETARATSAMAAASSPSSGMKGDPHGYKSD